jgi:hypothetical protein
MVPKVAPMVVQKTATNTRPITSRTRSTSKCSPTICFRKYVATTASNVLPNDIPIAKFNGAPVSKEPRRTPKVTPGQYEYPRMSNAARAMPVGGQTGEVLA